LEIVITGLVKDSDKMITNRFGLSNNLKGEHHG